MGTTWHVTYLPVAGSADPAGIGRNLEQRLAAVNDSMSTWQSDSEISRFNRSSPGTWVTVSQPFAEVVAAALEIGELSGGAYDVTVGPLVELWGFGPARPRLDLPSDAAIRARQDLVGQRFLELDREQGRMRRLREVELDLSSIAKGYAVDLLAEALQSQQITDFLVEVGGEMRLSGTSPRGDAWRVAVERPQPGARSVALGIALTDVAIATSGDYRNYFEVGGRRYSHSIDPRTGRPVAHDLVSVTVIAADCMRADGWATALTVLGADEALALAESQGLAVYLLRQEGERIVPLYSSAFEPWLDASNLTH
ncbi:MAG: FAD:protein FMN transferase [Haliea sp.]|uniref:FAD:protein FMN transferase n=1 Tax=Haliea sp. TaxID=1932666 RepID=UPI0032EC4FD7